MSNGGAVRLGRGFRTLWVLATGVGLGIGFGLGWIIGDVSGSALGVAVGKGVIWPPAGVLQWLLLRDKLPQATGWITAYVGAGTVIGVFAFAVGWDPDDVPALAGGMILGVMVGAVAGVVHWRLLRRHYIGTGSWVIVSIFGWAVGLVAGFGVAHTLGLAGPIGGAAVVPQTVTGILGGLACGAITGTALVRLSPKAAVVN